jgi:aspartate/methionine/tyrosine aminotransferase
LKWDLHPNPLSLLIEEKRRAGAPVLDLTESNPTRAGISYPGSAILSALADSASLRYDPSPLGLLTAREAVANYYARSGTKVDASQILLTASTSEAYAYLFKLLTEPGDQLLAPRPSYPLFDFLAGLESVNVRQYPLRYDGVWHIDFDALEVLIGERTKAVVVVNPNNPTGSFLKLAEAERMQELAARHHLAILSDEVFSDYVFQNDSSRLPTLAGESAALTFCMSGLSKSAGLPQMKLAWITVSGPQKKPALDRLEWIADTYLSVATPIQLALPRVLELSNGVREQIRERTATNLAFLRHETAGSPASVLNVEGGWYATLQVPSTLTEEQWAASLLRDCDVLVQPGFFYDFESEAFLVLSLLTESAAFAEGVRRMLSRF